MEGDTTYAYQLRAFVESLRTGRVLETAAADGVATMRAIGAILTAAGMRPRGT